MLGLGLGLGLEGLGLEAIGLGLGVMLGLGLGLGIRQYTSASLRTSQFWNEGTTHMSRHLIGSSQFWKESRHKLSSQFCLFDYLRRNQCDGKFRIRPQYLPSRVFIQVWRVIVVFGMAETRP